MISCGSIKKCRKGRNSCRAYRTTKLWQKDLEKWTRDSERIKNDIEELEQQIQKASLAEAELDGEIRNVQAGEERRGSCAYQPNGCCFDPAVEEHSFTMGAAQAWQQLDTGWNQQSMWRGASASASHSSERATGRRRRRRK